MAACPTKETDEGQPWVNFPEQTLDSNGKVDGKEMLKKIHQNEESSTSGAPQQLKVKSGTELGNINDSEFESLLQAAAHPLYERVSSNSLLQSVIDETDFKDGSVWTGKSPEPSPPRRGERRRSRNDSSGSSAACGTRQGGSLQNLYGKLDGNGRKLHKSGSLTTFSPGSYEEFGAGSVKTLRSGTVAGVPISSTSNTNNKTKLSNRTHSHHSDTRQSVSGSATASEVGGGGGGDGHSVDGSGNLSKKTVSDANLPSSASVSESGAGRTKPCLPPSGGCGSGAIRVATGGATSTESRVRVGADNFVEVDATVTLSLLPKSSSPATPCEVPKRVGDCDGGRDGGNMISKSVNENWAIIDGDESVENRRKIIYEQKAADDNIALREDGLFLPTERTRRVDGFGASLTRSLDENGNPLCNMQRESPQQQQQLLPRNVNHINQPQNHQDQEGISGSFTVSDAPTQRLPRRAKKSKTSHRQKEMLSEQIDGHFGNLGIDELVNRINAKDDVQEVADTTGKKKSSAKEREPNRPPAAARAKKASGGSREVARKNLENDACSLNSSKDATSSSSSSAAKSETSVASTARVTETITDELAAETQAEKQPAPTVVDPIAGWGVCASGNERPTRRQNQPRKRSDSFTLGDGHRATTVVVHQGRVQSPEQHQQPAKVYRRPITPPSRASDVGGRVAASTTARNRESIDDVEAPLSSVSSSDALGAAAALPDVSDSGGPVSSFVEDFYAVADVPPPTEEPEFCEVRKKKKKQQQQPPRQAFAGRLSSNTGYHRNPRFYNNSNYGAGAEGSGRSSGGSVNFSLPGSSSASSAYGDGARYGAGGGRPSSWNDLGLPTHHHHHHRGGRGGPEDLRRKSTSSVPPSEHSSADNSDVESVHSLPVNSTSPRQEVGKTSASSSCTPQASYADIAKMATSAAAAASTSRKSFATAATSTSSAATSPLPPSDSKRDACTSTHSEDRSEDGRSDAGRSSSIGDADRVSPTSDVTVVEPVEREDAATNTSDQLCDAPSVSDAVPEKTVAKVTAVSSVEQQTASPAQLTASTSGELPRRVIDESPISDGAVIAVGRSTMERRSHPPARSCAGGGCDDNPAEATAVAPTVADISLSRDSSAINVSLPSTISTDTSMSSLGGRGMAAGARSTLAVEGRTPSVDSGLATSSSVVFVGTMNQQLSVCNPADGDSGGLIFGFEVNEQLVRQTAHDMQTATGTSSPSFFGDAGGVAARPSSSATLVSSTPRDGSPCDELDDETSAGAGAEVSSHPVGSALNFGQLVLFTESVRVAEAEAEASRNERRQQEDELHNFNYQSVVDFIGQDWAAVQESVARNSARDSNKLAREASAAGGDSQK